MSVHHAGRTRRRYAIPKRDTRIVAKLTLRLRPDVGNGEPDLDYNLNPIDMDNPQLSKVSSRTNARKFFTLVQAVHVFGLHKQNVIAEDAADAILTSMRNAQVNESPGESIWQTAAAFDEAVESTLPEAIAGAASLGRTRGETIGTVLRMQWRQDAAAIAWQVMDVLDELLKLASAHTATVMGGFADRKAAAPTTLGHFLGGVIGELRGALTRLVAAIDSIDRSPLGAGLMVGEVYSTDREDASRHLGFDRTIENTFEAASSVEDFVQVIEAVATTAAVIRRFIDEVLTWIRTDPTSFFIDERWEALIEPNHPAHNVSTRLELLMLAAQRVEQEASNAVHLLRDLPYGPIGIAWSAIEPVVTHVMGAGERVLSETAAALDQALIVNRAYLANRAGRMYSTASDLAAFLIEDQQLSPSNAERMAGLAIATLKERSMEAAQITPDIIDAAAVLVIGQELKVEMETLGRYLAPRRYIERRDVLGSPKADRTRMWLENVASFVQANRALLEQRLLHWQSAEDAIIQELRRGEQDA